jgi:drug/metabolite transporter (DMT)-like permease
LIINQLKFKKMEESQQNHRTGAILLATAGVVLFSVKAIFVKKAYGYHIDAVSLLLIRMLFALPVYMAIAVIIGIRKGRKGFIAWKHFPGIIFFGLAGYYMASYLDFVGLQYISASLERLILFVYPTMVVVISAIIYKTKITIQQTFGILITYFGVFLIFYQRSAMDSHNAVFLGSILILGCALTYAIYLVGSGKLIPVIGSAQYTSYAMIFACIGVILHSYFKGNVSIYNYPPEVYRIGIGLSVISTILPSFLISEAIRRIGATKVAIIGSIGPISTIMLANIFLGEKINAFQWLGAIVVISGVLLVNINKEKADIPMPEALLVNEKEGKKFI